jgi:hypothetical protein
MLLWPTLAVVFLTVTSLGFIAGNAAALASGEVRDLAGAGSALMGALQFGLGASPPSPRPAWSPSRSSWPRCRYRLRRASADAAARDHLSHATK